MNRHQRRKRSEERKQLKLEHLAARAIAARNREIVRANMAERKPERSPRGCGNRSIYQALGMFPAPGYTSGCNKEKPKGERWLREHRHTR